MQAVVVHDCHGHRYRPSPIPLSYFMLIGHSSKFQQRIKTFQQGIWTNVVDIRKEGNVLFSDALNTFYLRLYVVRYMVKDHSDKERGNPLPPHGLLFSINSKGYFICTIPQTA